MKTLGERLRQAREYRRMTADRLAALVGYKSASGIINLENRATGHGGYKIDLIAKELDVDENWLRNGPDVDDMSQAPPYKDRPNHIASDVSAHPLFVRGMCNDLIARLPDESLGKALDYLQMLLHASRDKTIGAQNDGHVLR